MGKDGPKDVNAMLRIYSNPAGTSEIDVNIDRMDSSSSGTQDNQNTNE